MHNHVGHEMHQNSTMNSMAMYFNLDLPFTLLFKPWIIDSTGNTAGAFIGVMLIGILYEVLSAVRENLLLMASCRERCPPLVGTVTSTPLAAGTSCPSCPPTTNDSAKALVTPAGSDTSRRLMSASRFRIPLASKFCDPFHLAQTALHLIQMFFGYMLMLTAMTYNVYMLIAVMLGFTVGYFLFSRQRPLLLRSPTCCH